MAANKLTRAARPETHFLRAGRPAQQPPSGSERANQTAPLPAPWRVLFQIGGQNQTTVGLEVKDQLLLGRTDPLTDTRPDLDLTPYGGQPAGVSRRHVLIVRDEQNQALYVEDLNSTNGTRINGFWLDPGRRYRLRDGDQLELGDLLIVLRFVRSPYPAAH